MCTLMQKDVLIEVVANAMATIDLRVEPKELNNEDQLYLVNLRKKLYNTHHNDIDYQNLLSKVKNIKNKYVELPINARYA
ncbi:hypothetical protein [Lonepinella sp. BR2882]|uniref:hypothetical protein n=1 Tax=Lonepinella sp. BR2882 TaxID=3095283 RepID=UPI003F6DB9A7